MRRTFSVDSVVIKGQKPQSNEEKLVLSIRSRKEALRILCRLTQDLFQSRDEDFEVLITGEISK